MFKEDFWLAFGCQDWTGQQRNPFSTGPETYSQTNCWLVKPHNLTSFMLIFPLMHDHPSACRKFKGFHRGTTRELGGILQLNLCFYRERRWSWCTTMKTGPHMGQRCHLYLSFVWNEHNCSWIVKSQTMLDDCLRAAHKQKCWISRINLRVWTMLCIYTTDSIGETNGSTLLLIFINICSVQKITLN